jgi:hypothetical protein
VRRKAGIEGREETLPSRLRLGWTRSGEAGQQRRCGEEEAGSVRFGDGAEEEDGTLCTVHMLKIGFLTVASHTVYSVLKSLLSRHLGSLY